MSNETLEKDVAALNGNPDPDIDQMPLVQNSIRNAVKMGWNNETILRVIGCRQQTVDKIRSLMRKEENVTK